MASVMPGVRHVKPGDRVVVETICTKTQAEVVWQVKLHIVVSYWIIETTNYIQLVKIAFCPPKSVVQCGIE